MCSADAECGAASGYHVPDSHNQRTRARESGSLCRAEGALLCRQPWDGHTGTRDRDTGEAGGHEDIRSEGWPASKPVSSSSARLNSRYMKCTK